MQASSKDRMFHIVLVQPEIPPNTGNIIRLAANTGCNLHLVEPLGFSMQDKQMRRAGLDYHEYADVKRHASWQTFVDAEQPDVSRCFALTTHGKASVFASTFQENDWLVFGAETSGLSTEVRAFFQQTNMLRLPMLAGQRSLNLSNAVAITVYEAWRQNGFAGQP
jgi:tRNA (cytidine/uridine-2'-O-)-methyltransferase